MYSGEASRKYKLTKDGTSGKFVIKGEYTAGSHLFENANVAMNVVLPLAEHEFPADTTLTKIIAHVEHAENNHFDAYTATMNDLNSESLKLLRMKMPYTGQLVDFNGFFIKNKNEM